MSAINWTCKKRNGWWDETRCCYGKGWNLALLWNASAIWMEVYVWWNDRILHLALLSSAVLRPDVPTSENPQSFLYFFYSSDRFCCCSIWLCFCMWGFCILYQCVHTIPLVTPTLGNCKNWPRQCTAFVVAEDYFFSHLATNRHRTKVHFHCFADRRQSAKAAPLWP